MWSALSTVYGLGGCTFLWRSSDIGHPRGFAVFILRDLSTVSTLEHSAIYHYNMLTSVVYTRSTILSRSNTDNLFNSNLNNMANPG